jgi:iron complex outermembrane receptor protein
LADRPVQGFIDSVKNHPNLAFGLLAGPCLIAVAAAGPAWAQQTVVITGSVVERAVQDAPYAITVVGEDELRSAGPMINLSEALQRVPGLVVNNRSNYAQDLQISSRGFGARATFGVRGLRLYADGIPASGPDGQGQVSHFDIAGAERVEVLRGPFSALYGNSSGGVISIFTARPQRAEVEGELDAGSFGLRQVRVAAQAPLAHGLDLRASASAMEIDGFRPQSAARKRQAAARLGWTDDRNRVVVLLNHLDQPAQDPLGLDAAQFALGPEQTTPRAIEFDTRKDARQTQLGVSWRHRFGEGALRESTLVAYGGTRSITQWLSIPAFVQLQSDLQGGGVVDFDRDYHGVDARARWGFGGVDLVAGVALDRQRDDRRGYENFVGSGADRVLGVTGDLRRDEVNRAETRDVYAQAEWTITPEVAASLGLRHGRVDLSSVDHFLSNGDDSGAVRYHYTTPVAGLRWQAAQGLNLYASLGRGYESPTLGEVAYRVGGLGGFNTALKAQQSRQLELGAKWRRDALSLDLALFEARTDDELGVVWNENGRSAYGNVGRTKRRGAELALSWAPAPAWRTQWVASTLDARYRNDFLDCGGTPCGAGNRIAGAPRGSAWAELAWRGGRWGELGVEWRAVGSVAANDANDEFAGGYATAALRWSKSYPLGSAGARMEWLLRVDNLLDRHYAGSVIVNDGNRRYYEPGAPRNALVALRLLGVL